MVWAAYWQGYEKAAARLRAAASWGELFALSSVEDVIEGGHTRALFQSVEAHVASHTEIDAVLLLYRADKCVATFGA
ncbi:hypothetical protein [Prosthecobacter algae]|uniref:hypothetical protein n=1 Tax=Prosthecobacter algae TaxID=1144682 RepID=UPI0031E7C342